MITMTPIELARYVHDIESRGTTMVTLSAMTDAKARKTDNPYGPVRKLNHINGTIGYSFANAVLKAHGVYEPQPRAWGYRWEGSRSIVEHNGALYLSLLVRRSITHPLYYIKDGELTKTVPAAQVAHLLPIKHERLPQVRDYRLDNVLLLKINGQRIRVDSGA